jgi:hypothetical protein
MTALQRETQDAHFLGAEKAPIWELDDRDWEAVGDLIRHHGLECFTGALCQFVAQAPQIVVA